ncbi:MAG: hypothetical protein ACKKL4_00520 [Patescibacteria group bacterium]
MNGKEVIEMDGTSYLISRAQFEEITKEWHYGDPLPQKLHPSIFRPNRDAHPYWFEPGKAADLRGAYHEERLKYLIELGKEEGEHDWIRAVRLSPAYSVRDRRGIDLTLDTCFGKVHVQVKSSLRGMWKFLSYTPKFSSKKVIPCVVVHTDMTDEEILYQFVQKVRPFLLKKKREKEVWDREHK